LNEAEVACARRRRLKELHMWSIIREGLTYISFLRGLDNYSIGDKNDYFQRKNAVHVKNGRLR
jgi:hypothetical protein